jgi:ABC-type branched-subunit amino acid transport system substrate-binding protein
VLGAPIGLVHADSAEGAPDVAAAELERLLASGVHAVVGPISSATAAAALERTASTGAVLVTPGATATSLDRLDRDGRLFRTAADEVLQGRALAALVLDDGPRRVDVIARADEHGRTLADAFATALADGGGEVVRRLDREPTAELGDLGDLDAEATVVIGLAESATVIDALEAADRGPRRHPTYGTDGNLGERLGDLVADRRSLACMRGLLPVAPADADLTTAVARTTGLPESELDPAALDHAAEAYDAVVIVALAAEVAGTAEPAALAAALDAVTRGGTPCDRAAPCLDLARAGTDLAYVGRSGRAALDGLGNRTRAVLTLVAFDDEGHLVRLGGREVGEPPGT